VVRAAARPEAELRARLRRVCEAAELDENRARRWAQARAALDVLWMLALPEPEYAQVARHDRTRPDVVALTKIRV
jgi:hypothetical protein